jgi:hypothetical protein
VDIFGRLDIMVCNADVACEAGSDRFSRVHEQPEKWFDKAFAVKCRGRLAWLYVFRKADAGAETHQKTQEGWPQESWGEKIGDGSSICAVF